MFGQALHFLFIAKPMGLGAFSVLFPLKMSFHTAWTVNGVLETQYKRPKQKRVQGILALCKFHYCLLACMFFGLFIHYEINSS